MEKVGRVKKELVNFKEDAGWLERFDKYWAENGYSNRTDAIHKILDRAMNAKELESEVFRYTMTALKSEELSPVLRDAILHALRVHMGEK